MKVRLLLASNSPRRRQLLGLLALPFDVRPVNIDERALPGEPARSYVLRLAHAKAMAAATLAPRPTVGGAIDIIVASDTTVADGDVILGKPTSDAEAQEMLERLRGRTHRVYTAVALLRVLDKAFQVDVSCTLVEMRSYSDEEMLAYIASGDPLDKAGAYAIQHQAFHPVENVTGCYSSVVGFPLCHVVRSLRQFGVPPAADVPAACQAHFRYTCPVFSTILAGKEAVV